jgi:hypothetical protein
MRCFRPTAALAAVVAVTGFVAGLPGLPALPGVVASASAAVDVDPAKVTTPVPVDTALSNGPTASGQHEIVERLPASVVSGTTTYTQSDQYVLGIPSDEPCAASLFLDVRDPDTLAGITPRLLGVSSGRSYPIRINLCDGTGSLNASVATGYIQAITQIPHAIAIVNVVGKVQHTPGFVTVSGSIPGLAALLAPLGFTSAVDGLTFGGDTGGAVLSGVGGTGLPAGRAWQVSAGMASVPAATKPTAANVHGWFVRTSAGHWQFAPMRWAAVDTSSTSSWNSNGIRLDVPADPRPGFAIGQTFTGALGAGDGYETPVGGFQLVVLDPETLTLVRNTVYATRFAIGPNGRNPAGPDPDSDPGDLPALVDALASYAGTPDLVVLQSIGAPFTGAASRNSAPANARATQRVRLAEAVRALGGTPQAVLDLGSTDNYALVTTGDLRVPAQESSPQVTPGTNGRVVTALSPAPVGQFYTPQAMATMGSAGTDLLVSISTASAAWPHPANADESQAFASIASALNTTPTAFRDQYRTSQAASLKIQLDQLTAPTTGAIAWTTMRNELDTELTRAIAVHAWFGDMADVVAATQTAAASQVSAAVAALDSELRTDYAIDLASTAASRKAYTVASSLLTSIGGVLGLMEEKVVKDSVAAFTGILLAGAQSSVVDPTEPGYQVGLDQLVGETADQVAKQLPDQLVGLGNLEALVSTDYLRLTTMYLKVASPPSGSAYYLDTTTKAMLVASQQDVAKAAIYAAVVHAYFETYPGYRMPTPNLLDWGSKALFNLLGNKLSFGRYGNASTSSDVWPQPGTTYAVEPTGLAPMFSSDGSSPTPMSSALLATITGSVDSGGLGVYRPYVLSRWAAQHRPCDLTALPSWLTKTQALAHPFYCYS